MHETSYVRVRTRNNDEEPDENYDLFFFSHFWNKSCEENKKRNPGKSTAEI